MSDLMVEVTYNEQGKPIRWIPQTPEYLEAAALYQREWDNLLWFTEFPKDEKDPQASKK